jgi:hypothetical protein
MPKNRTIPDKKAIDKIPLSLIGRARPAEIVLEFKLLALHIG